ncbi:olfactory receptor 4B13-like [Diadema antillarum]|uniref:olfactory receptor 4B13-like n=1 Tax=Diadema antillarum TaxID=105358 RepID=UPI003A87A350
MTLTGIRPSSLRYQKRAILIKCGTHTLLRSLCFTLFLGVFCLTVVSNTLVLLLVLSESKLRHPNYYYLNSLALSDLVNGLVGVPSSLYFLVVLSPLTCSFANSRLLFLSSYIFSGVSLSHLITITADRHFAITKPLKYMTVVTQRMKVVGIACSWLAGIIYGVVAVLNVGSVESGDADLQLCSVWRFTKTFSVQFYIVSGLAILILGVLLCVCNLRILRIAMKQSRREVRQKNAVAANGKKPVIPESMRQVKAIRVITSMVCVFCGCWFPTAIRFLLKATMQFSPLQNLVAIDVVTVTISLGSLINPFIYCVKDSTYRNAFAKFKSTSRHLFVRTKIHV